MNREIKFRAWDEINNNTIYPDAFLPSYEILKRYENVMQYTGLKDKKRTEKYPDGREICEGDVVKFSEYTFGDNSLPESIETIKYKDCGYNDNLQVLGYQDAPKWCEVIGNIYENPELLEENNES